MKYRSILVLVCLLFPLAAIARDSGTAKGTITFNKKPKSVSYVYAWKEPDLFNKGQMSTVVVLTDSKIDDATLADRFAMIDSAKKGKFTAVQISFDPKGEVEGGTFYSPALDSGYFDASGMHEWHKKTFSATTVEGKLGTDGERKFFDTSYAYSAEFKAPIGPAPKK